jgi:hypothetical protein
MRPMTWQAMRRADAQKVVDAFFQRSGATFTISFEEFVQLREAFLVLLGVEPEKIRGELEEAWGKALD